MKYTPILKKKSKVFKIPALLNGVNKSLMPLDIMDTELAEGINIWNKNSVLQTRPGLYCEIDNVMDTADSQNVYSKNFHVTDTHYIYESKTYKIAYSACFPEFGLARIFVFLIGDDRSIKYIGEMFFSRTTDTSFYSPKEISFFVGKEGYGKGIYAFVHLENILGEGEEYRIFEVNKSLSGWQHNSSYYIPTVLINGRGNLYEIAKTNGCVFSNSPKTVESLNLLNSSFYSYYTSDGYSSNFRLPFSALEDSTVIIRVYDSLETYTEWTLYGGVTSETMTFENADITVSVDREKGVVYFSKGGEEFPVPRYSIYSENNIRILANKVIEGGFEEVLSCQYSAVSGSRIVFSGGKNQNKIYSCKFDNPLYFPQNSVKEIGSPDKEITALKSVKGKVFAFKENEIYTVSLKTGAAVSDSALVIDEDKVFYKSDEFDIECVSKICGSTSRNSIVVCNDIPVWLGADGYVYGYKNSVFRLTENIEALNAEERALAVAESYLGQYFLCYGAKAIIIDSEIGSAYFWEFPEEVKTLGIVSGGNIAFVLLNTQHNLCFLASLKGSEDIIISKALTEKITLPIEIESVIKTKEYSLCNFGKSVNMNSVCLRLLADGDTEVTLNCDKEIFAEYHFEESDFSIKYGSYLRIIPDFPSVNMLSVTIKSKKGISFSTGEVYYTE